MRKIKSIQRIFLFFLLMIVAGFFILYQYSKASLKESLMHVAQIQMEHSGVLLEQKVREIEIEADGIIHSEYLKDLQLILTERYHVYDYVMSVNEVKKYLNSRQKSTTGMAGFILFWPESFRVLSTASIYSVDRDALCSMTRDNQWFLHEGEVYFVKRYITDWDEEDEEPYLMIKMDRDYLYRIKSMAFGMESGGTLLTFRQSGQSGQSGQSLFPVSREEEAILSSPARLPGERVCELTVEGTRYQVLSSCIAKNGMEIISYFPLRKMLRPVGNITWITGISLALLLLAGFLFLIMYYKNIMLQMQMITGKLRQVEEGDLTARITQLPDNEFAYVFRQFNHMTEKIRELLDSALKEQQLRHQAELRQLQLQINPHFLYNSLSYIVTVADKPEAVTQMAVHLANYYRYCTVKKSIATIGEEVQYARAYLSVIAMRKQIEYDITVPEELYNKPIIPLLLQPVIENAIEHAIEERENAKHIYIKAYALSEEMIRFEVSDDGEGLSEKDIEELVERIGKKQRKESESVGLWNVNQRLVNYYDKSAGLRFGRSIWGGLMVYFTIGLRTGGGGINDSFDCG